jgi:hypothetical protein
VRIVPAQVKIALKLAGVKKKRQVSQKQLATLARFKFTARQRPASIILRRTTLATLGVRRFQNGSEEI